MIKKIVSSLLLVVLFTMQFSSVAFAVSVSEDTFTSGNDGITNMTVYDFKIGGGTNSDDQHVLALEYDSGLDQDHLVYLVAADGDSNFTKTTIASNVNINSAKMVLDSAGDPHLAWADNTANSTVYYKEKSGSTWYSTITVQTSTSSSGVGLDVFATDGGTSFTGQEDADDPILTVCDDGTNAPTIAYYTVKDASGTGNSLDFIDSPAVGGSEEIASSGDYMCNNTDIELRNDSSIMLVGIKDTGSNAGNIFQCSYGGTWNCSTVVTGIYKWDPDGTASRSFWPRLRMVDGGGDFALVYTTADSGDTTSLVKFILYSTGSWGSPVTIASGADLGENMSDVAYDSANDRYWVSYFDENNDDLYIAYSDDNGSTWTTGGTDATLKIDTAMGIDNTEPMTYSAIAFDDVPETSVLYVTANSFNGTTITGARYKITSLPAGGGGGGVPEFGTYVYLMTLLVGFGMIHKKSQERGSVLA